MRAMLKCLPLVFGVLFVGCSRQNTPGPQQQPPRPPTPQGLVEEIATRIRSIPMDGWSVSVEGIHILIKRDKPVIFYCTVSLPPRHSSDDEQVYYRKVGQEDRLCIALRVDRKLSVEEYGAWLGQRHQREGNLKKLHESLSTVPRGMKGGCRPETVREKELVARYHQAWRANFESDARPVFFTENATIYLHGMLWSRGFEKRGHSRVFPKKAISERASILARLNREFTPYE